MKEVYSEALGVTSGLGLMMVRIGAGVTTGTLAILAAQPTDVVKVTLIVVNSDELYNYILHFAQKNFEQLNFDNEIIHILCTFFFLH